MHNELLERRGAANVDFRRRKMADDAQNFALLNSLIYGGVSIAHLRVVRRGGGMIEFCFKGKLKFCFRRIIDIKALRRQVADQRNKRSNADAPRKANGGCIRDELKLAKGPRNIDGG